MGPEGIWKRDQASNGTAIITVVGFGAARFCAGFDHVGQFVVGARATGVQLVEYRHQGFLAIAGQQAVYVGGQAGFPIGVLNPVR